MSVYCRDAQAGRHDSRHEPRARRPPDARPSAQLLRQVLQHRAVRRHARTTSGSTTTKLERLAREHRPKMIVVGASAYPRQFDFARIRAVADEVGALVMTDMAHIAGLVAAGVHPNPGAALGLRDDAPRTRRCAVRAAAWCSAAAQFAKDLDRARVPRRAGRPADARHRRQGRLLQGSAHAGVPRLPAADRRGTRRASRRASRRPDSGSSAAARTTT